VIAVTVISEPALRRELSDVLSTAGWAVHNARDAEHALLCCSELEADVLLVDETLPGGAVTFLDRVNSHPQRLQVGVVVVGAHLDVDDVVTALQRGAADVLRTPVNPADAVARATAAARTKALVKQLTSENQRIEGLVMFDELTGLRNRRATLLELDTMIATARRHERPLAALMIDIDRFKAINDTHGHRAGDEVLRKVGARLSARLRHGDVGGRLGGDELLVLLPETDGAGAAILADSIRTAVAERPIQRIPVTVSIGAAAWEGEPAELLIERADQALYAAKAAGRDRAVAL
jgi:two-component system cell cycle response regulator